MRLKVNQAKNHETSADWILQWLDVLLGRWLLSRRLCPRPAVGSHLWCCWWMQGPEVNSGSPASAHHPTGSEELILVSTNTQGTSGYQMEVCVQPSKHTPPQNSPDPLINWSWWRRRQAAESLSPDSSVSWRSRTTQSCTEGSAIMQN